jgi:hypothetical protein
MDRLPSSGRRSSSGRTEFISPMCGVHGDGRAERISKCDSIRRMSGRGVRPSAAAGRRLTDVAGRVQEGGEAMRCKQDSAGLLWDMIQNPAVFGCARTYSGQDRAHVRGWVVGVGALLRAKERRKSE